MLKCSGTTEKCSAMSDVLNTYSHLVSCHDNISDVMERAVVIAQRRLNCHLGQKRQLGICHQDVVFFRADLRFLIVSQVYHCQPAISLITSSSAVDCDWRALSVAHGVRGTVEDRVSYQFIDTKLQNHDEFLLPGLAVICFISSQFCHRASTYGSYWHETLIWLMHTSCSTHVTWRIHAVYLFTWKLCLSDDFLSTTIVTMFFFSHSLPSTFGHRQTVLFDCKRLISQRHPWPCSITALKLELL